MALYDDQIKSRKKNDEKAYREAISSISDAINGKKTIDEDNLRALSNSVVDEILNFFKIDYDRESDDEETDDILSFVLDDEEESVLTIDALKTQIKGRLDKFGITTRKAGLADEWEKSCNVPMVAITNDGNAVALIPNKVRGYTYKDFKTGKKIKINKKNVSDISKEVLCFYEPLPLRKLKTRDILRFAVKSASIPDIFMIAILTLLLAAFDMVIPVATDYLFGDVIESMNGSLLAAISVTLVCMSVSSLMMNSFKALINNRLITKLSVSVDSAVMMRILSLPAPFFKEFNAGELTKRFSYVGELCTDIMSFILDCVLTFILSFSQIYLMNMYAPELIPVVVIVMVMTLGLQLINMKYIRECEKKLLPADAKEYGLSYSIISGIQKIKLAGAEKRAFSKWGKAYAKKAECMYNPPLFLKISGVIGNIITILGTVAIFIIAFYAKTDKAAFFAFDSSYAIFSGAFMSLSAGLLTLSSFKPTIEMIRPIMDTCPEYEEGKTEVKNLRGLIELEHVSFSYDSMSTTVIDDLSLKIKPGDYVAIVGTTGCGKSTLLKLMMGFEKPTSGKIYYDNKDLETLDIRSLRRKIGTVTQTGRILNGSIYSNIVVNDPTMTMEDAWRAAEIAQVAEDIERLPMGMQTLLVSGGRGLSGGQRQRIMIARALATNPKVVIFDEATSALDNITQMAISRAMDNLKCTRIVVAHRLSTIKNCNRIIVLDKGKIIEDGTYEELIENGGFFAELVSRQRIDVKNT